MLGRFCESTRLALTTTRTFIVQELCHSKCVSCEVLVSRVNSFVIVSVKIVKLLVKNY